MGQSQSATLWLGVAIALIMIVIIALTIFNIIQYNRSRQGVGIPKGEANTLFWLNIIVGVLAVIGLILGVWLIFIRPKVVAPPITIAEITPPRAATIVVQAPPQPIVPLSTTLSDIPETLAVQRALETAVLDG
jgi:predicted membrane protein